MEKVRVGINSTEFSGYFIKEVDNNYCLVKVDDKIKKYNYDDVIFLDHLINIF